MSKTIDKRRLLDLIIEQLESELATFSRAAAAAHEAATHDESKPEDQYDTRGLEASYLAGAQAKRAGEIEEALKAFRSMEPIAFAPGAPIAIGAWIELESEEGKRTFHLLAARAGGMTVQFDGKTVQILTPSSPVGDAVIGRKTGDAIEIEVRGQAKELGIVDVA